MDKVYFREARSEDKDEVLKIHTNVFEGRDYLKAYYDHFLTFPGTTAVIALLDGKIIAYIAGQIIDNGETMINRCGRTHPDFQGKGIITRLNQYAVDLGNSQGARNNIFAVSDGYRYMLTPEFKFQTRHILTKQYPWYWISGQGLMFTDHDIQDALQLQIVSDGQLSTYFKLKSVCHYLAPEGRMLIDSVPYKMIDANIPNMMQPKQYMEACSDIQVTGDGCTGLLSFGLVYPIARPQYKYILDIFGTEYSSLRKHIVRHLRRLKEKTNGVTALLVYVSDKFDIQILDDMMNEFGILRHPHAEERLKSRQVYAYEGLPQEKSNL